MSSTLTVLPTAPENPLSPSPGTVTVTTNITHSITVSITSTVTAQSSNSRVGIIVGPLVGVLVAIPLLVFTILFLRRRCTSHLHVPADSKVAEIDRDGVTADSGAMEKGYNGAIAIPSAFIPPLSSGPAHLPSPNPSTPFRDASSRERLTDAQLDIVQRLAERGAQEQALSTVISSMLRRGAGDV